MKYALLLTAALLSACATQQPTWNRAGASQQDWYMESGQCRAQAMGVYAPLVQQVVLYQSCLQGKGWYQQQN
jgi:hypothetical protein